MIGSSPIVGGVVALIRCTSPLQWVPLLFVLSLCMRVYPATYMQRSGIHIFLVIILSVSILNLLCCCVVSSFPVFPLIPVGSSRPYKFFYWYFFVWPSYFILIVYRSFGSSVFNRFSFLTLLLYSGHVSACTHRSKHTHAHLVYILLLINQLFNHRLFPDPPRIYCIRVFWILHFFLS